jgi:hypothetical protein
MDQGAAADRFVLKFINAKTKEFMASSGAENGLLAWFEGSEINVWTEGPFSGQYSLFGLDGKQHQFGSLRSSEGGMLRIPLKAGIQPGIYLFRTSENRGATSFAKILVTP